MAAFTWIIVIVTGGFILIETQGKLKNQYLERDSPIPSPL